MDIIIVLLLGEVLDRVISVVVQKISYLLVIGLVKIYGHGVEVDKDVHRIENVSGQEADLVRDQDASQEDVEVVRGQDVDRLEDQEDVSQDVVDNNFSDLGIFENIIQIIFYIIYSLIV